MDLITIGTIYLAILIVVALHELGHAPKKIKFKLFPIPHAVAMQAKYRLGGLIVNIILFISIFYLKPEMLLLQIVGLVAWSHFIIYAILGSILPEKRPSQVNIKTYVFDDVPNKDALIFISLAVISYILLKSYYLDILLKVMLNV